MAFHRCLQIGLRRLRKIEASCRAHRACGNSDGARSADMDRYTSPSRIVHAARGSWREASRVGAGGEFAGSPAANYRGPNAPRRVSAPWGRGHPDRRRSAQGSWYRPERRPRRAAATCRRPRKYICDGIGAPGSKAEEVSVRAKAASAPSGAEHKPRTSGSEQAAWNEIECSASLCAAQLPREDRQEASPCEEAVRGASRVLAAGRFALRLRSCLNRHRRHVVP